MSLVGLLVSILAGCFVWFVLKQLGTTEWIYVGGGILAAIVTAVLLGNR